eukprot:CAMPEP_0206551990 /NCGR_PEP_ID=MMETSP0325_2-20121206/15831_1 /ASSEMBLY_ACC=CAM_ASM_000347 /TAXON_ID=2866 /ORGANISM="Crypthecodinium cohnii, Strain Seligo" /LENGTH=481 /DNA_ID=CAMNT_0054051813 /DNA_START=30 /DNA_END=1472 /DNA_ORIENTATION=-
MAAPPYRDLLVHLCAEIERQEAQLGEQSNQIEELQQENARLMSELEDLQRLTASCPTLPPSLATAATTTTTSQTTTTPLPTTTASAVSCPQSAAAASAAAVLASSSSSCSSSRTAAPTAARTANAANAAATVAASLAAAATTAGTSMQSSSSSSYPSTSSPLPAKHAPGAMPNTDSGPLRNWSGQCGNALTSTSPGLDGDATSWSLSPTTLNSSNVSQFWMNLQSNSSSPANPDNIADALDHALSSAYQGQENGSTARIRSQAPDVLLGVTSDVDPVRLVRMVLSCLDDAQQRRRRAAKLRRRLNGGQPPSAQPPDRGQQSPASMPVQARSGIEGGQDTTTQGPPLRPSPVSDLNRGQDATTQGPLRPGPVSDLNGSQPVAQSSDRKGHASDFDPGPGGPIFHADHQSSDVHNNRGNISNSSNNSNSINNNSNSNNNNSNNTNFLEDQDKTLEVDIRVVYRLPNDSKVSECEAASGSFMYI